MDEMIRKFRTANPIWQFGFAFCSTLVVGGAALLVWINAPVALDAAELAYRTIRAGVGTLAR